MEKFIPYEKLSKKKQRELNTASRPPRHLDHQPGDSQTRELQSLSPQNGTELEGRFQFRAVFFKKN